MRKFSNKSICLQEREAVVINNVVSVSVATVSLEGNRGCRLLRRKYRCRVEIGAGRQILAGIFFVVRSELVPNGESIQLIRGSFKFF